MRPPLPLQFHPRTKYSSSLGWSWIYSANEEENPSGHVKNYCGDPHRDILAPSAHCLFNGMDTWAAKIRECTVNGRKDDYWADNLPFTSPKCGIFAEQSNCCTPLLLLPLALTQNYRVFAIMKNYPINRFNFKP